MIPNLSFSQLTILVREARAEIDCSYLIRPVIINFWLHPARLEEDKRTIRWYLKLPSSEQDLKLYDQSERDQLLIKELYNLVYERKNANKSST